MLNGVWDLAGRILPRNIFQNRRMASGGEHKTNRLAKERSPYLLQHKNNPVDWYPWGEEAFQNAKKLHRPIFLSVGYSTCHWCHVMERESFESDAIAEILNKYYISIKVDREERPDVDKTYMTFIQAISGSGGWPMSVFLTPTLEPITGGTYFPPEDSYGRPGFASILKMIAEKWSTEQEQVKKQGAALCAALKKASITSSGSIPPSEGLMAECFEHLSGQYDKKRGGFGSAPKFPKPVDLDFLMSMYATHRRETIGEKSLTMVEGTLNAIARGGIHDHVAKGFHRYSVDADWHVPHFEKMLYDQGQLLAVYSNFYAVTGKHKDIIEDICDYVNSNLSHSEGGFFSAEDADSLPTVNAKEKREGAFCVWTKEEIDSVLALVPCEHKTDLSLATVFENYYTVEENGNVPPHADPHGELTKQNVLIVKKSKEEVAKKFGITVEQLDHSLALAKAKLNAVRSLRPKPHLDDKMLAAWNGLMISGFARAAAVTGSLQYIDRAMMAVNFIKKYLNHGDGKLLRAAYNSDGAIASIDNPIYGFADDYAFVIQGLLDLYEVKFDADLLKMALELQLKMDELFWDREKNAGFFLNTDSDKSIIMRMMEEQDGAEPATNSVAASNLLRLSDIFHSPEMRDKARQIFEGNAARLSKYSFVLPKMLVAYRRFCVSPMQIVIVGSRNDSIVQELMKEVSHRYLPFKTLISLDKEKDAWLMEKSEYLAGLTKAAIEPGATVFICENYSCSLPLHTVEQLKERLDGI